MTTMLLLLMALVDVCFPGLCHEDDAQMVVAVSRTALPAALSDEASENDLGSSAATASHLDHCFCCCRHFLAVHLATFDFTVSRPEAPLQVQQFLPHGIAAPVFHPPRLA